VCRETTRRVFWLLSLPWQRSPLCFVENASQGECFHPGAPPESMFACLEKAPSAGAFIFMLGHTR